MHQPKRVAPAVAERLTQSEVTSALRVSRTTLMRYEAAGLIHPYRVPGGHRRYDRAEVEALAAERAR
ncbi:hypothetical protein GCM10009551_088870 [Nocardiopsis tropica]